MEPGNSAEDRYLLFSQNYDLVGLINKIWAQHGVRPTRLKMPLPLVLKVFGDDWPVTLYGLRVEIELNMPPDEIVVLVSDDDD